MYNRVKYIIIFVFAFLFFSLNSSKEINAVYTYGYCNTKIANTELYDCGNVLYTYYEDKEHSTVVKSSKDTSILYAGKIDNMDIFYVNGFKYYNYTYDDRVGKNNMWAILTSRGKVVFDGSFKDSWIVDESHSGRYIKDYLNQDIYTIRQYINNGDLYRTIVLYNHHEGEIEFKSTTYDDIPLQENETVEVLDSKKGLTINIESIYGVKSASILINGVEVKSKLVDNNIVVNSEQLREVLLKGETNIIEITAKDYFGMKKSIRYKILLVNNSVLLGFSTMDSVAVTSSRRIIINALAGRGKTLDKDYCWYYWSDSPDDGLSYEEFLKNYARSSHKGSYSEDKGVILRNTSGTYYLYALAKDDDSTVVKRTEGFKLDGSPYQVAYDIYDAIFVAGFLLCAVIPIVIYLYIRKREYR